MTTDAFYTATIETLLRLENKRAYAQAWECHVIEALTNLEAPVLAADCRLL